MSDQNVWQRGFGHECPSVAGTILPIMGVGRKDTYNLAMFSGKKQRILAFRAERRRSFAWRPKAYHPMVFFATEQKAGWQVTPDIPPFDMMEDPFFVDVTDGGKHEIIFGGVRIHRDSHKVIPQTEFYKGSDITTLVRQPFLVVDNMKDIRLKQLPDGRFLLCRRPWGGEFGRGRVTLHIIDNLQQVGDEHLKTLAVLGPGSRKNAWVGINDIYIVENRKKQWIGLLGHVAFDTKDGRHYAACTFTIVLEDLLDNDVHDVAPHIIASRSCFDAGPAKRKTLSDVVFPGHLEHLEGNEYRLWAGLSDARIGTLDIVDPFGFSA